MTDVIVEKWKREDAVEFCRGCDWHFLADAVETMDANEEGTVTLYRTDYQFYIDLQLAEFVASQNELLCEMRSEEDDRKQTAEKSFLARMDELEHAANAEISAMVTHAKHIVLRIDERLYGAALAPAAFPFSRK